MKTDKRIITPEHENLLLSKVVSTQNGRATTMDVLYAAEWPHESVNTVNWILIRLANKHLLERPFGIKKNADVENRTRWLRENRPNQQSDQQVWDVTEAGRNHSKTEIPPDPIEVVSPSQNQIKEGTVIQTFVNAYERNPIARKKCIEKYGWRCSVCEFDFAATYGLIGAGFIHVHHLKPLSEIKKQYVVNPIKDLRPVCPNCHAMLHSSKPPMQIDELKKIFEENKTR